MIYHHKKHLSLNQIYHHKKHLSFNQSLKPIKVKKWAKLPFSLCKVLWLYKEQEGERVMDDLFHLLLLHIFPFLFTWFFLLLYIPWSLVLYLIKGDLFCRYIYVPLSSFPINFHSILLCKGSPYFWSFMSWSIMI